MQASSVLLPQMLAISPIEHFSDLFAVLFSKPARRQAFGSSP
jgi:hypothetical protein